MAEKRKKEMEVQLFEDSELDGITLYDETYHLHASQIQGVPLRCGLAYNIQYLRNVCMYQNQILYMCSWTLYEQLLFQQLFSPTPNFGGIDLFDDFLKHFTYFWNFLHFEIVRAFSGIL